MSVLVADASAALAILLKEDVPQALVTIFASEQSAEIVVPPLWSWEVTNIASMAVRRAGGEWREMEMQLLDPLRLPTHVDQVSVDMVPTSTARMAVLHNNAVHDASYLELALRGGLPLATLDRKLAAAALSVGIEVIGTSD